MANNPLMKFQDGVDYELSILKAGEPYKGKYGQQYIYEFMWNGVAHGYFATENTHGMLSAFQVGDTIIMGKHKPEGGQHFMFQITKKEGGASPPAATPPASPHPGPPPSSDTKDWDLINAKQDWYITKKTAMNVTGNLLAPEERGKIKEVYQYVFGMLMDDTSLVINMLSKASTMEELQSIWIGNSRLWNDILSSEEMAMVMSYKETLKGSLAPPDPPPEEEDEPPLPF